MNAPHAVDALVNGAESEVADGSDTVADEEQMVDLLALAVLDDVEESVVETALDHARSRLSLLYCTPFVGFTEWRRGEEERRG